MSVNCKILGIDLAGKSENPTGICFLDENRLNFSTFFDDDEILRYTTEINPSLIVIDAPISLPKGRCCLSNECNCSKLGGHFRKAEVEMRKYGRTLPLTFRGMRMLTERGIKLANELKKEYKVIESHPRTIQRILGFEDPLNELKKHFEISERISEHELDAALLIITGIFYLRREFMEFGDDEEGLIILPKNNHDLNDFFK